MFECKNILQSKLDMNFCKEVNSYIRQTYSFMFSYRILKHNFSIILKLGKIGSGCIGPLTVPFG